MKTWDWTHNTTNQTNTQKTTGTWDKGLNYETTYKMLKSELDELRRKPFLYKKQKKKYAYLLTFLLQLRNGCRIWEAITGMITLCINLDEINWNDRVIVKVRTQKRKDGELRDLILPKCVNKNDIELVKEEFIKIMEEVSSSETIEEKKKTRLKIVNRLGTWLSKNYGINSHSFRYAYITYLGEQGIPSQVLAKITKHQNINYIEKYTQSKLGSEILKNLGNVE
ncbi:tyrosine-type recombinase/integrase [Methanothermococcus thermolithotrophicus]|uniref:tyrosine-type recombinase/integrase n=1 Tax=Methanothermococcus thermolithotrophicus TaxID=2186 RepID=UPI00037EC99E|nr:tyrosine-type recombinase/integrase [Methanothermococcus thermolithotrophicus]MDK2946620.1 hypothetical protein [Geotoga sp.]